LDAKQDVKRDVKVDANMSATGEKKNGCNKWM